MIFSKTFGEIAPALAKAWGEIGTPKHNRKVDVYNKEKVFLYSFNYTDLAGIMETIKKPFKENNLTVLQNAFTELNEKTNKNEIHVETLILHSSGEYLQGGRLTFPAHYDMQQLGGQITYMKRYSISTLLGLATEEDDDGNGAGGRFTEQQGSTPKGTTQGKGTQGKKNGTQPPKNQNSGHNKNNNQNNQSPVDEHTQPFPEEAPPTEPPKKEAEPMTVAQKTNIDVRIAAIAKDHGVPKDEVYPRFQQLYEMVEGRPCIPNIDKLTKAGASKIITKLDEHLKSTQPNAGLPALKFEGADKNEEGTGTEQPK